jgi:hypothetical protein
MNWTVIWLDESLQQLAGVTATAWGTPVSTAIVRAMARIELLIETDPTHAGESRDGHRRIAFEWPVTVEFEVHAEQRTAIVTRVRYTPGR